MIKTLARRALSIIGTALLAAFLAACLARMAPGFESDGAQLDPRLSQESVEALRAERARNRNIVRFYTDYLARAVRGDLGRSQLFHRPAAELIAERITVTGRLVALGLLAGWMLGLGLATSVLLFRRTSFEIGAGIFSGIFLCLPVAVLALAFVLFSAPAWLAVTLVVFPKIFAYSRNLLLQAQHMPHVLAARARGLRSSRLFAFHVLPVTLGQTCALAGVSVSMAIGATIPIESLLDIPGLGQLAWEAALGRDLTLLVGITLLVSLATLLANAASDLFRDALPASLARRGL
ncbi:MAG: ABC transporter permease [Candidatus Korobacteraceae bacterium]